MFIYILKVNEIIINCNFDQLISLNNSVKDLKQLVQNKEQTSESFSKNNHSIFSLINKKLVSKDYRHYNNEIVSNLLKFKLSPNKSHFLCCEFCLKDISDNLVPRYSFLNNMILTR